MRDVIEVGRRLRPSWFPIGGVLAEPGKGDLGCASEVTPLRPWRATSPAGGGTLKALSNNPRNDPRYCLTESEYRTYG